MSSKFDLNECFDLVMQLVEEGGKVNKKINHFKLIQFNQH
jgi:hypothetical protein